jgi:pimeloyl-ACP methyl ester carboxylesterase
VRYDFDGAGLSPLSSSDISIDSLASDAMDMCDSLGIDHVRAVVGHSMSGLVATTIAARFAKRMDKLVLMGAIMAPTDGAPKLKSRADMAEKGPSCQRAEMLG